VQQYLLSLLRRDEVETTPSYSTRTSSHLTLTLTENPEGRTRRFRIHGKRRVWEAGDGQRLIQEEGSFTREVDWLNVELLFLVLHESEPCCLENKG